MISNPPYVPESDRPELSETVMHDPELALFADDHGLAAYREIIRQIGLLRKPPRLVAFEIGYDQGESVPKLIQQADPEAVVQVCKTLMAKIVWFFGVEFACIVSKRVSMSYKSSSMSQKKKRLEYPFSTKFESLSETKMSQKASPMSQKAFAANPQMLSY